MQKINSVIKVDALTSSHFSCQSTLEDDVLHEKIQKALDDFCRQEVFSSIIKKSFESKKFVSFFRNISTTDKVGKIDINIDTARKTISFSSKQTKKHIFLNLISFMPMPKTLRFWSQEFFISHKNQYEINCIFSCLDDSVDLKDFKENVFKFANCSKIAIRPELQEEDKKTIKHSPFCNSISAIMEQLNKVYSQHYITHWWNKEKQEAHFTIRKKTWMEEAYNREVILNWLKCFLPDFERDIRLIDNEHYPGVTYLGSSRKFDIHVIESPEFLYADKIRGIAKTCWFNNMLIIYKKYEPWDTDGRWWRIDFWWSKNELSQSGKVKKTRHTLTSDTNTRHFFGPEKFIPYTYDISEDSNYTDLINYSAKSLDDVIYRLNIKRHLKIENNDFSAIEKYPIVDFCTNINPIKR